MIISSLSRSRDFFNLFLRYDPEVGISSLFQGVRIDQESVDAIYRDLGFDNFEKTARAAEKRPLGPKARLIRLLTSREFQHRVLALALNAFPEKKRLVFIHVPKCAGSNLSSHLRKRYPSLANQLMSASWTSTEALFEVMKRFVTDLHWSDEVYVHGHLTLEQCRTEGLIRSQDRVITVLRDPREIVISAVNYVITGLLAGPAPNRPDRKFWSQVLNIESLAPEMPQEELLALAKRILHETPLVHTNQICRSLGKGDALSAIGNIKAYDIEMTSLRHYDSWLETRWNIRTEERVNISRKILTAPMLEERDRDRLVTLTSEDQKVFDLVQDQLAQAKQPFVMGAQLALPDLAPA